MQDQHLTAMGIHIWRLRSSSSEVQPRFAAQLLELQNSAGECPAYLLLTTCPSSWQPETLVLLDAMLTAIHLQRSATLPTLDCNILSSKMPKPILVMGEDLAQYFLRSSLKLPQLRTQPHYLPAYPQFAVFATYTAAEVLANAALKRLVWQDLCCFRDYLLG